jgi:hypothetical protein
MTLDQFIDHLWQHYVSIAPSAGKVRELLEARGDVWINDHIAFRTYDRSPINLEALEPHLLGFGYERYAPYAFEDKKIRAFGYLHPEAGHPRIFLSELETEKLTLGAQQAISALTAQVEASRVRDPLVLNAGLLWQPPSRETYETLLAESEYAGWVAVNGLCANHFTVSVNGLTTFASLEELLDFLESRGFEMNISGGRIKGTAEVLLEQGSTIADRRPITLAGGEQAEIATCYVEFARRYQGFDGFVPASADKIFESTDLRRA